MSLQDTANLVLSLVRDAGAEGDLIVSEKQSLSLKAQEGKLDEHAVNSSRSLGLRVVHEGQVGSAFSEATDEDSLRFMVDQALTNARFSKPNPDEIIAAITEQNIVNEPFLTPEDSSSIEDKIDFIIALESKLAGFDDIRNVPYNAFSDTQQTRTIFNSHGGMAQQSSKGLFVYAYPLAAEGELTAMAGAMQAGRTFTELNLDALVKECHESAAGLLHGESIPTGRYDVVFDRETQPELMGAFRMMWSAKWAQDGINPLRDKLGQSIFDARLHIVDYPTNQQGLSYARFDDEGVATQDTTLVEGGVLTTFAHNSATAKHFGVANTGHASRSAKSPLGVSLHQLHILAGPDAQKDVVNGDYFEITSLDGLHSGTNPISGEFSCGASGYLCNNGERVKAVRGVTVAGNLYEMLNNIVSIGNETQWDASRSTNMPSIRFAKLAISGK